MANGGYGYMAFDDIHEQHRAALARIAELEAERDKAKAELTRIREALTHNCDQSGCPSIGPHSVGDVPPHKASLYRETIRALQAQLAERALASAREGGKDA